MLVLLLAFAFQSAAMMHMTAAPTPACKNGTKVCTYAPGKTACCLSGEACVPNVGCRCQGDDCLKGWTSEVIASTTSAPTPGCANGTKLCVFAPGKSACCTPGEGCVPNVGCRCEGEDCLKGWTSEIIAVAPSTGAPTPGCANGTKVCVFAPGKSACCTPGESCVPNVGCRCEGEDCLKSQFRPTPSPTTCANGTKVCEFAPGKSQCCTPGEACVQGIGCRCDGEDCQVQAELGIFGTPRSVCGYGKLLEGAPLNVSLKFTAVTWNLEGWAQQPHNVARQANVLLSYGPDFIATQEDRYGWDIQKAMGEGHFCFMGETRDGRSCSPSCPTRVPLSSNGGDGEHTFIYYNCKKWQVLETNTYYMGIFPLDGFPRVYTNGLFQNLETRHLVWVTSTHFPKKKETEGQKQCIKDILNMGDASRGNSLLMGDFNINEEFEPSPSYKPLHANRFSFDSFNACSQCRFSHGGYDKHFATFQGFDMWVDDSHTDISDHNPIIAYYEL